MVIRAEDKGTERPAENTGISVEQAIGGTNPTRADQLPNNKATENDLLAIAKKTILASRRAIEKLVDATPLDDLEANAQLGPILAELRASGAILERLALRYNA